MFVWLLVSLLKVSAGSGEVSWGTQVARPDNTGQQVLLSGPNSLQALVDNNPISNLQLLMKLGDLPDVTSPPVIPVFVEKERDPLDNIAPSPLNAIFKKLMQIVGQAGKLEKYPKPQVKKHSGWTKETHPHNYIFDSNEKASLYTKVKKEYHQPTVVSTEKFRTDDEVPIVHPKLVNIVPEDKDGFSYVVDIPDEYLKIGTSNINNPKREQRHWTTVNRDTDSNGKLSGKERAVMYKLLPADKPINRDNRDVLCQLCLEGGTEKQECEFCALTSHYLTSVGDQHKHAHNLVKDVDERQTDPAKPVNQVTVLVPENTDNCPICQLLQTLKEKYLTPKNDRKPLHIHVSAKINADSVDPVVTIPKELDKVQLLDVSCEICVKQGSKTDECKLCEAASHASKLGAHTHHSIDSAEDCPFCKFMNLLGKRLTKNEKTQQATITNKVTAKPEPVESEKSRPKPSLDECPLCELMKSLFRLKTDILESVKANNPVLVNKSQDQKDKTNGAVILNRAQEQNKDKTDDLEALYLAQAQDKDKSNDPSALNRAQTQDKNKTSDPVMFFQAQTQNKENVQSNNPNTLNGIHNHDNLKNEDCPVCNILTYVDQFLGKGAAGEVEKQKLSEQMVPGKGLYAPWFGPFKGRRALVLNEGYPGKFATDMSKTLRKR